jgi:hypothetical protein
MKRFISCFFALTLLFAATKSHSCDFEIIHNIELGSQPMRILFDPLHSEYHVFCNGNDINYNAYYDEELGEEKPSWWKFSISENNEVNAEKIREFDFGYFTPTIFLPGIDIQSGRVYLPFAPKFNESFEIIEQGKIAVFDLYDHSLIEEELISLDPSCVTVFKNIVFIAGQTDDFVDMVYAFDKNTYELLDQIQVGPSVQHVVVVDDPNGWIVGILNEGIYGQNNSNLMVTSFIDNKFGDIATTELGDTGNTLSYVGIGFAATMNGSHEIVIVEDNSIYARIEVESTGFDGPRELIYDHPYYIVSSYDGTIAFYYRISDRFYIEQKIELDGKADAMLIQDDMIFVCSPLDDSYNKLKSVYVLKDMYSSINDNPNDGFRSYPNPADTKVLIDLEPDNYMGKGNILITNIHGGIVYNEDIIINGKFYEQIDVSQFSQGIYFVKITYGNETKVSGFSIIR